MEEESDMIDPVVQMARMMGIVAIPCNSCGLPKPSGHCIAGGFFCDDCASRLNVDLSKTRRYPDGSA